MKRTTNALLAAATLTGCVRETPFPPPVDTAPFAGRIVINEVAVNGDDGDWIELHNPGPAIPLEQGSWFLSDDPADPFRFELPAIELEEGGFIVVRCSGDGFESDVLTAPFGLNGHETGLALSFLDQARCMTIDHTAVQGSSPGNASVGRAPDGTGQWTRLAPASPGGPNDAAQEP
ncbi:MAG: lamin tail domain-containing protein [Flavobacteriales bacterium]|nr:lamin tail domain-containing protein [Flavobacteriales bacterium]